jgi:tetratricopeptide (TPR) repeat protein
VTTRLKILAAILCIALPAALAGSALAEEQKIGLAIIMVRDEALARSIAIRLEAGESFEALARQHSVGPRAAEGGGIGSMAMNEMHAALREAIGGLRQGQVSKPFALKGAFAIVKVTEAEGTIPMAEAEGVDAHFSRGAEYLQQGQFSKAVAEFQIAVELAPSHAAARVNLGAALDELGRYQAAIDQYRKALELDPSLTFARINWAVALNSLRQHKEALARFDAALVLDLSDEERCLTLAGRGDALRGLKRTEDALAAYNAAGRGCPPDLAPVILNNMGLTLMNAERTEEAVGRFRQTVALAPDYPDAHLNLGVALADMGRHEEAMAHYKSATELEPDLAFAYYNWGNALIALGRADEGRRMHERAIAMDPSIKARLAE